MKSPKNGIKSCGKRKNRLPQLSRMKIRLNPVKTADFNFVFIRLHKQRTNKTV